MHSAPPKAAPELVLLAGLSEARRRLDEALQGVIAQKQLLRYASKRLYEESVNLRNSINGVRKAEPRSEDLLRFLAPRERQVLKLIAQGFSTKEIAGQLGISFKTAVCYRTRLLRKVKVHESASLVRLAIQAGLLSA